MPNNQPPDALPPTEQLLTSGGDARIALDPSSGLNKYGCPPLPDPELLSFGSSTASVISTAGFAAANQLREKLLRAIATEPHATVYARETQRIRSELLRLCELSDLAGLEVVLATSGTDAHLIAAQYAGSGQATPTLVLMVEANETGSGVAAALSGHQADTTGQPDTAAIDAPRIANSSALEVVSVPIRLADGAARSLADVDNQIESLANEAVALGRRVLLILVDQSKTGLIAPSPACAAKLHHSLPDSLDILVDACQFRIAPPTLRAYLEHGFMVALTGSKFVTGPSFSAALLLPLSAAQRLRQRPFPTALQPYSCRGNWPTNWDSADVLNSDANFGLLLRWEAALEEMRRFHALPQTAIVNFIQSFDHAVRQHLTNDPAFEILPVPQLDRSPLIENNRWDHLQTVFSFLLYHPKISSGRMPLCREETLHVYKQLQTNLAKIAANQTGDIGALRIQLGQPVACGKRNGIEVSALRLCASARLIADAVSADDKGVAATMEQALAALSKAALIAGTLE
ncbi:MAG: hypothetical protein PHP70_00575 [Gallionella sp.]|nr:hypothetical protein [Gallionella sp.]